jgi:DHA2 family multidrug resistance protein
VSPRGIGAIVMMPVIGFLTSRTDNRLFIAAGFSIFGITSLWFANLTLSMSQWTPIIISGAASGMVFVPLSTATMGTLSNQQMGNASGLYNLLRNIGGSIGISMVDTMIAGTQLHRAELAGHLSRGNPVFDAIYNRLAVIAALRGAGSPRRTKYALLQQLLDQQAATWSYVDDFRHLAIACFVCVPIVFLLRKVIGKKGAAAAAH